MTQLFNNNEQNQRFFNVFRNAKVSAIISGLISMNKEIIGSRALGEVIFDNALIDVGFEMDREFFVTHYAAIFKAMSEPLTLPNYEILVKSLLGDTVEVEFKIPKPGHLVINVIETTQEYGLMSPDGYGLTMTFISNLGRGWAIRPDKGLQTRDGKGFAFRHRTDIGIRLNTVISTYTLEQARHVLENLITSGVYTEYNFVIKGN